MSAINLEEIASQPMVNTVPTSDRMSTIDVLCWRILIWVTGLATPFMVALKPRRFLVGEIDAAGSVGGLSQLAGRGFSLFFLFFLCFAFLRYIGRCERMQEQGLGRGFWVLTTLMVVMPTLSTFVSAGTLSLSILGTVALYSATFVLPTPPLQWWVREVRIMLLCVFVYGSLGAAIISPRWAWDFDYADEATTAILPFRLFGMAEHANSLAPIAIFAWMLGRFPGCRFRGELLHGGAVLLVLLLTQSKTNWFIAFILVCIYCLKKLAQSLSTVQKYFSFFAIGTISLSSFLYLVKFSSYAPRIEAIVDDPQVLTLTGRLPLWLAAVEMWREKPWFGQGLDAWSASSVSDYIGLLGWGATHAHNQLLQILSESGIVGLVVFIIWVLSLRKIAQGSPMKLRSPFYWLILLFFMPGVTEVILQYGLGKASAVRTWILFTMAVLLSRQVMRPSVGELDHHISSQSCIDTRSENCGSIK